MEILRRGRFIAVIALVLPFLPAAPGGAAEPERVTEQIAYTASDGVQLQTTLKGVAPMQPRPTVIEFSPYGRDSESFTPDENYNHLLVQIRGTGDSRGSFDALGPQSQADVAEVLQWACHQPWSNGRLGLHGFSASAIVIYNSMHQELPCVDTATLRSGTLELYRDLLMPGGVTNLLPGVAVILMIAAPAIIQGPDRLATDPVTALPALLGLINAGVNAGFLHPTLDTFWQERGFRGDANDLPILAVNGVFDVESRGAFQGYQELRHNGSHLLLAGGHDGTPAGTDGGQGSMQAWFDHHLRDIDNGITEEPAVQLTMSDGDREDIVAGRFLERDAEDWPVPGTTWASLNLDATRSGAASTPNDGSLTLGEPQLAATQTYVPLPTAPWVTDVPTASILNGFGFSMLSAVFPPLTEMGLAGLPGLSYTTPALTEDVIAAGPASLEVKLSTLSPETAIWAVISDVHPDGSAHPLTAGRLLSSFPDIIEEKSIVDENGTVVQPYGDYSAKTPLAGFVAPELYQVELWPIANRFKEGHRIRVDIVGASLFSLPTVPLANSVEVGPGSGSRLIFPVLPESDLESALATPEGPATPPEIPPPGGVPDVPDVPDMGGEGQLPPEETPGPPVTAITGVLPGTGSSQFAPFALLAAFCSIAAGTRLLHRTRGT